MDRLPSNGRDHGLPRLTEVSDAWLAARARELVSTVQCVSPAERRQIGQSLEDLLIEAQRRGEPVMIATLLRSLALARLSTRGQAGSAESLLDDLLAHSRRHGLTLHRADAHALRGHRLMLAGRDDDALAEIARALAISDGPHNPDTQLDNDSWAAIHATTLIDCWLVLSQLGVYEAAEEVITRAEDALWDNTHPHELTLQLINRIIMLLSWGLRLERVNRFGPAAEKFRTAAAMAKAVDEPFRESLFPRAPDLTAVDQLGVLAAAVAFDSPGQEHIDRLNRLAAQASAPHECVLVAIALARSLDHVDRRFEAWQTLAAVQSELAEHGAPAPVRLNLARELARLDERAEHEATRSFVDYAAALENELWSLRESHLATLNTRREHERLSAEHGAIAQQALQDPLTGLPNRRALDKYLRALVASVAAQPLAVALFDLDGFKDVNDQHSHAVGDNVLRVVANTVREALRADDIVARYGGDEFIALLPGAPASAAKQALKRAIGAVNALPAELAHGVTLSIGLASVAPQERAEQVLARADAAMYRAKRGGGNQIALAATATEMTSTAAATATAMGAKAPEVATELVAPVTGPRDVEQPT